MVKGLQAALFLDGYDTLSLEVDSDLHGVSLLINDFRLKHGNDPHHTYLSPSR